MWVLVYEWVVLSGSYTKRGDLVQPSFLVYEEPFPVGGPVGRLNEEGEFADDLVGAALEVIDLQAAGYVLCHGKTSSLFIGTGDCEEKAIVRCNKDS